MKIIVSPAKAMEEEKTLPTSRGTQPVFFKEAVQLNRKLGRMTKAELSKLMGISQQLADLNYHRYQQFDETNATDRARPAVYLYAGDTYQGLEAYTLENHKLDSLQDRLRIITGMYGILRPLDLIQPYRLEMGVKLPIQNAKDLYEFWTAKITAHLNKELKENELLINLASHEYAKAVEVKKIKAPIISPRFKDFKNGQLKIISFYAKKARGAMARYLIEEEIEKAEDLLKWDALGYQYSERYTEKEEEPVFVR